MITYPRTDACRSASLMVAFTILLFAGCYKELDVSKITCDVSDKGSCPSGYQCSAGRCLPGQAAPDAASAEASQPSPIDTNNADSAPVVPLDAAATDSPTSTTTEAGATEAAAMDLGSPQGIDAGADGPQTPALDGGANDLPVTGGVDASDASASEGGKAGIDAGTDARTHTIKEFYEQGMSTEPYGIAAGPDGNLWFTENWFGQIVRLTPTGVFTAFLIPTANSGPTEITAGPDGNLWFTEYYANKIGCITPKGAITEFSIPTPSTSPNGITAGSDGNLWFTELAGNQIGRITPAGVISEFKIPTADTQPSKIVQGPDGNLWFGESNATNIGRITTAGVITEFAVPRVVNGLTVGPDGNIWHTTISANMIGRMTLTGVNTDFPLPTSRSGPYNIVAGPDGNLWFTERLWFGSHDVGKDFAKIGRMTMAGAVTEFPLSSMGVALEDIVVGPDGNLWFTETNNQNIGRINP